MSPKYLCIVGWSGSGKSTLVEMLVPELQLRGVDVVVVKHSSEAHPIHKAGSDTHRFERAGATAVGFATPKGFQLSVGADAGRGR